MSWRCIVAPPLIKTYQVYDLNSCPYINHESWPSYYANGWMHSMVYQLEVIDFESSYFTLVCIPCTLFCKSYFCSYTLHDVLLNKIDF